MLFRVCSTDRPAFNSASLCPPSAIRPTPYSSHVAFTLVYAMPHRSSLPIWPMNKTVDTAVTIGFSNTVRAERSEDRHRMTPIGVLRHAAPCGKLIRKAQSCAVPTISVVPRAAPWRLPLFYGRLTDWLNKLKALSVKVRGRDCTPEHEVCIWTCSFTGIPVCLAAISACRDLGKAIKEICDRRKTNILMEVFLFGGGASHVVVFR